MRKKFCFPPLKAAGFRFRFPFPTHLRVLGDHGAPGGVRSPPRAEEGLRFLHPGQSASLGPWTLQFLSAISGVRPPPRNAGQGCKTPRGKAGRRVQGDGGGVSLETTQRPGNQRVPSFRQGEPRPARGARAGATWESGADRLRVRKYRLGQRVRGVVEEDQRAFLPVLHHTQITEPLAWGYCML